MLQEVLIDPLGSTERGLEPLWKNALRLWRPRTATLAGTVTTTRLAKTPGNIQIVKDDTQVQTPVSRDRTRTSRLPRIGIIHYASEGPPIHNNLGRALCGYPLHNDLSVLSNVFNVILKVNKQSQRGNKVSCIAQSVLAHIRHYRGKFSRCVAILFIKILNRCHEKF